MSDKFKVRGLIVALGDDPMATRDAKANPAPTPNPSLISNIWLCKQSKMVCVDTLSSTVAPSLRDKIEEILAQIKADPTPTTSGGAAS
jgi:hypothetical protein